jgi:hypothetical protein
MTEDGFPVGQYISTHHNTIIEKLRAAVSSSSCSLLDRPLIDVGVVYAAATVFRLANDHIEVYDDVPLTRLFVLNRKGDTWKDGDSWRDVAIRRLHGRDWTSDVFDYFEGEIENKMFPSMDSRGVLNLVRYGGVVVCTNGNHRLAAAYCWLASTQGDAAKLLKVKTTIVALDRHKIRAVMNVARTSGAVISVCEYPSYWMTQAFPAQFYIKLLSGNDIAYYGLDTDLKLLWSSKKTFGGTFRSFLSPRYCNAHKEVGESLALQRWTEIPMWLLEIMEKDPQFT